jgi:hypothetical protein
MEVQEFMSMTMARYVVDTSKKEFNEMSPCVFPQSGDKRSFKPGDITRSSAERGHTKPGLNIPWKNDLQ